MNAVVEQTEPPKTRSLSRAEVNPMQMLATAISKGVDLPMLEKLMDLEKRWREERAKSAYVTAFAAFKHNMPDVIKDMLNKQYGSDYSSLANLVNTTNRVLGEYGLHANWKPDQSNGVAVTCTITHVDGHSESVTLAGPLDTSGQKNPLQQIKSTLTYLEGATFQAITGVVARSASKDDDGNGAGGKPEVEAPEGFENWRADMAALADEGIEKLQTTWKASSAEFRRYVIKCDETWWNQTKSKAAKVKTP